MKSFRFLSISLLSLLMASCQVNSVEEIPIDPFEHHELVFEAVSPGASETKTIREDDGSLLWSVEDEINIFYKGQGGSKFISQNSEPAKITTFVGTLNTTGDFSEDGGSDIQFFAAYPYNASNSSDGQSITLIVPSQQKSVPGSFSKGMYPMVARSATLSLPFYNVCGGLKFSLSREDIVKIQFAGNLFEPLAGNVKVAFGEDGIPVSEVVDGECFITLTPEEGETFTKDEFYFITAVPTALTKGFTMTFYTADGKVGVLKRYNSLQFKRSVFGRRASIDALVTEWNDGINAVDLGLSVKWADCDLGALSQYTGSDILYAWGETSVKETYTWDNYIHNEVESHSILKYGPIDEVYVLEAQDDIAAATLGDKWRMPTNFEFEELRDNCTWTRTSAPAPKGFIVTSRRNNASIFIADNSNVADHYVDFWSASFGPEAYQAKSFSLIKDENVKEGFTSAIYSVDRYVGYAVRPVYGDPTIVGPFIKLASDSLDMGEIAGGNVSSKTITITNTGKQTLRFMVSDSENPLFTVVGNVEGTEVWREIAAGASTTVRFRYSPLESNPKDETIITFFSNAVNGNVKLNVFGGCTISGSGGNEDVGYEDFDI